MLSGRERGGQLCAARLSGRGDCAQEVRQATPVRMGNLPTASETPLHCSNAVLGWQTSTVEDICVAGKVPTARGGGGAAARQSQLFRTAGQGTPQPGTTAVLFHSRINVSVETNKRSFHVETTESRKFGTVLYSCIVVAAAVSGWAGLKL